MAIELFGLICVTSSGGPERALPNMAMMSFDYNRIDPCQAPVLLAACLSLETAAGLSFEQQSG